MRTTLCLGSMLLLLACSSDDGGAPDPGASDAGAPDQHTQQQPPTGPDASTPGDDAGETPCTKVTAYVDSDGDGIGAGPAIEVCAPIGPGYASVAGDCDDSDGLVFPGQTTPQPGAKDYDCSGEAVPQDTKAMPCNASGAGCGSGTTSTKDYWLGTTAPACGEPGTWVIRCGHIGGGVCEPQTEQRTQRCL